MGTDSSSSTTFKEGDRVLVTEGDLKNLDGVVVSVNEEGKLMVKASLAELAGNAPLTIDAQHVVKFFQVGLGKCPVTLSAFLVAPRLGGHTVALSVVFCARFGSF